MRAAANRAAVPAAANRAAVPAAANLAEVQDFAAQANMTHGRRLTEEEPRVQILCLYERHPDWSVGRLCDHLHCTLGALDAGGRQTGLDG